MPVLKILMRVFSLLLLLTFVSHPGAYEPASLLAKRLSLSLTIFIQLLLIRELFSLPPFRFRLLVSILLGVPMALILFVTGIEFFSPDFEGKHQSHYSEPIKVDGVEYQVRYFYEVSHYNYGKFACQLQEVEYFLDRNFKRERYLVEVRPCASATITLLDDARGKRIRFVAEPGPKLKQVVREFDVRRRGQYRGREIVNAVTN
jgi:hypothetical protein